MILVVGATGTIGREVVKHLLDAGQRVRVLVRDPAGAPEGVDVAVGDLTQPQTLPQAFAGVQRAFLLAPFPFPEAEKMEINAFVAAEQAGVEHFVYLSNFGAGRFEGDLWAGHGANEWRLRALRSTWTILRPVRFMSSLPFVWTSVLDKGRLLEPHAGRNVVVIDPSDVGAVAARVMTEPGHEGKIYELSGQTLTGSEIAAQISAALGRTIRFVDASDDETRHDLVASGLPLQIVDATLMYFETVRAGLWYETSAVADLLGRPPRSYADWLTGHMSEISG
ncbi:NmrA family NAD(P)-binding protein [Mycolicibacterium moriokaense]|uniref:Uncharacterized protein YbjT (DUF2867 family) n=1 Tax=Mycolicibacterium moriokaense TaxID=39691 RepID=A0A318H585_9MYCO|nr:NmrA family NAD(P)-binding protein [Mycolicibacterium moriokaense]PXW98856.1 uncharacterized protein YbjT (DUF2867 family) [Mycolicibacterium moriokaense]